MVFDSKMSMMTLENIDEHCRLCQKVMVLIDLFYVTYRHLRVYKKHLKTQTSVDIIF